MVAAAIGELDRGIDMLFDLPTSARMQTRNDGSLEDVDDDALLESAIRESGKVVLATEDPTRMNLVPRFAGTAAGIGSARSVIGDDGAIRQVRAVERITGAETSANLGFALRVATLALRVPADRTGIVVERNGLRLKPAGGGDRFVPLTWIEQGTGLMQVPVFGARDWFTAYDVPAHRTTARHVPFIAAYEPIECERKIIANDLTADRVIGPLAEIVALEEFKVSSTQPSNWPAYRSRIERVLKGSEFLLEGIKELGPNAGESERNVVSTVQALRQIVQVNDTLAARIDRRRELLRGQFNGRVVLVGGVATGLGDRVPTSLHNECPGVVVHGMAVNGILSGELWRCMPRWVDMLVTFAVGLLMTWVAASARVVWTVLLAVLIGAIYAVVNGVLVFDWGNVILSAMGPIVAIAVVTVVALTIRAAAGDAVERRVGAAEL
jgi:CHASE2 domain-containing sensor protein